MKILCKKSKIISEGNCIHNGITYEATFDGIINNISCYTVKVNKKYYYRTNGEHFLEYFYTPEETKNMLRTKLIDKML